MCRLCGVALSGAAGQKGSGPREEVAAQGGGLEQSRQMEHMDKDTEKEETSKSQTLGKCPDRQLSCRSVFQELQREPTL